MPKKWMLGLCLLLSMTFATAAELTISAAATLTNAFKDMAQAFEAQNPDVKVRLNFGASDALAQQVIRGAPVDVVATADQEVMDRLAKQNLLQSGSRANFAGNTLVVVVPVDAQLPIRKMTDLSQSGVKRIAVGHAAGTPIGRYARQAIEKAGLWTALEPKMIYAQNVRQSLDYVARKEVEAGFVFVTDANSRSDKVKTAFIVPTAQPITYPMAVVKQSPQPEQARRFVQFVLSPAGQTIMGKYGFKKLN